MPIIILVTVILFLVVIAWTWTNLGKIEKKKKIVIIVISIIITYVITLITFLISKTGINYENQNMANDVQNLLVAVFTAINGLIVIQYVAKIFGKINNNEIDKKTAQKKLIIIAIIFLICIIIEASYLKDIQNGILDVYYKNKIY